MKAVTPYWVSLGPIWVLPDYFDWLKIQGIRRLVVLSSTSRYTKNNSSDLAEQVLAQRLADAEAKVQDWAESHGVEWVILRPTLIYGLTQDKNISEIARFIHRFGFFRYLAAQMVCASPFMSKTLLVPVWQQCNSPMLQIRINGVRLDLFNS